MRHHRPSFILAVAVLASGVLGCRSAAPDLAPQAAAPPAESVPPVATAAPVLPPPAPAEEAPRDDAVADATIGEAPLDDPDLGEEEPSTEPEALQKWALELCQSAEQLLDEGDAEGALSALDRAYELMLQLPGNGDDSYLQAKEDIRLLVADLINRHYRAGRSRRRPTDRLVGPRDADGRQRVRAAGDQELHHEGARAVHRRLPSGSGRYRPMILAKLEEAGLPSQLSWLPMVESWFKVRAYSRASAVGMWQFISSTGLRYGLSRDAWVDERFNPEKSTDAAIGYLTDLHGMFGDWPKALAGYNCGEARVARLQRRSKTEYLDFWDLYERLPRETRRYVPRLFAAIAIIENPEKYGMTLPEMDDPDSDVLTVTVERAVKLEQLDAPPRPQQGHPRRPQPGAALQGHPEASLRAAGPGRQRAETGGEHRLHPRMEAAADPVRRSPRAVGGRPSR